MTEPTSESSPRRSWRELISCAWKKECPRCRIGRLFRTWYTLNERCPSCSYSLEHAEGNTWFFMYVSSGAVVGLAFLYMLFFPPANTVVGWLTIMPAAGAIMFATLPHRKALAIMFEYYLDPDS